MLTIFTVPKSFLGHINIIQRNAIKSWTKLTPKCEIILFGNEEGTAEIAKEFGLEYIPDIERNEFGTPIISEAFNLAQKLARNSLLAYINADVILMSDFIEAIKLIELPLFLANGRRWDIDIKKPINFDEINWEKKLINIVKEKGVLHGYSGIDYFVFPKNIPCDLPKFVVGRHGLDNWFIYHVKTLKIPVIDATNVIMAVHQNHASVYENKINENQKNLNLAGGFSNMCSLRDADWILTPQGLTKPPFPRRIFSEISLFYPWRKILGFKRQIQNRLQ